MVPNVENSPIFRTISMLRIFTHHIYPPMVEKGETRLFTPRLPNGFSIFFDQQTVHVPTVFYVAGFFEFHREYTVKIE